MRPSLEHLGLEARHCLANLGADDLGVTSRVHHGGALAELLHDAVEVLRGLTVSRVVVDARDGGREVHRGPVADLGQVALACLDERAERGLDRAAEDVVFPMAERFAAEQPVLEAAPLSVIVSV